MFRRAASIECAVGAAAATLALAACGGSNDPASDGREESVEPWERVAFDALDGTRLEGRLYGGWRDVVVVLSHMGRFGDTQADWYDTASSLADAGYGALTYNRRGVCPDSEDGCSEGTDDLGASWMDVVGAYERARTEGARAIVLVGASIGAMSSLKAASMSDVDVAGVVEIGGINDASGYSFTRKQIAGIEGLKIFASSRGDIYGGAEAAREWHSWATPPKRLAILAGVAHGTDIVRARDEESARLVRIIHDAAAEATR